MKKSKLTKILALTIVAVLIVSCFVGCGKKEDASTTTNPITTEATTLPPPPAKINPLTGEANYPEELIGKRSVLVSVENHPQARPQWGIASADIVWELLAEGGITRMLCMFSDASRLPDKIGPTRSARHYFVEIAEGFDSIFIHFGGSPQGYDALNNHNTDHVDGMSDSGFSRDKSRNVDSEHTAYTTKDGVVKNIEKKQFRTAAEEGKAQPFKFNETPVKLSGGACTKVSVPFSSSFTYKYTYDAENNVYLSTLNGNAFKDDNGTQQSFTNIIIVYSATTVLDSAGRISYDFSDGKGVYISNGTYENITWKKGDYSDIMKFYGADGEELSLNVGRSYIALVPTKNQGQTVIE